MNIANIDIDIDIICILLYVVDSIERSLCTSSMMMTITLPYQWQWFRLGMAASKE